MNSLNTSVKHNIILASITSLWIFIFAYTIKPFDDGTLNPRLWFLISVGFSFAAFLSYGLLIIVQKKIYLQILKWNAFLEIGSLFLFYIFYLTFVYPYYKSIITGGYTFVEFIAIIFLKAALVFAPIFFITRRYISRLTPKKEAILTIKGENKLDILKVDISNLVCISNSQNYVEIFYLENDKLETKIIRTTLKKMVNDFSFLIQVHRSHLINPLHFKSWKNKNTIFLTQIELPVSKSYKEKLLLL